MDEFDNLTDTDILELVVRRGLTAQCAAFDPALKRVDHLLICGQKVAAMEELNEFLSEVFERRVRLVGA